MEGASSIAMTPGTCFICSFPMPPIGFVSLATAEGKYAVHQECRARIPEAFCDGMLTAERVRRWRETGHVTITKHESRAWLKSYDPWHWIASLFQSGMPWRKR